MHMGPKKYRHCPNVWVEDACKVLGRGFNFKRAIGATEGVMDKGVAAKQPMYLVFYYIL
jgi:hypothetical protein